MRKNRRRIIGLWYDLIISIMGIISYLFSYVSISMLNYLLHFNLTPDHINIISASIFFLISWYGLGIIINHRSTGPMVAVKRHLSIVANGDYYINFRLRKGDDLNKIVGHVNSMTRKLIQHENASLRRLRKVKAGLDHLIALSDDSPEELSKEVGHFVEHLG